MDGERLWCLLLKYFDAGYLTRKREEISRITELETLLDSVITEASRTITPALREKIDVALNKNKTVIKNENLF